MQKLQNQKIADAEMHLYMLHSSRIAFVTDISVHIISKPFLISPLTFNSQNFSKIQQFKSTAAYFIISVTRKKQNIYCVTIVLIWNLETKVLWFFRLII